MSLSPDFLDELRTRVAVSDIVRRRVQLRKQGREWAGLSPFNKEKTPSFFVNDEKRFYHCFSSGKHGDVFSFLMEIEGQTFREAVETVAEIAGMDVPAEGPEAGDRRRAIKGALETLVIACDFFESQLRMPVGRNGMAYLKSRGLDDATIRRFRLGYAPAAHGSLAAHVARDGITEDLLVEAGLMKHRDGGRASDYFRDRIMFPITDRQGRTIGFGGRALGDAQPKYLNSPETPVFHKGGVLYGLSSAREPAHKSGRVLVVEGYMDVIALAQAGINEAVAPLGTAIGEDQIRLLWTLASEPVICLDGDRAGRAAAIRSAERALPALKPGKSLRFAMLPQGEDPDTLVRKQGTAAIEAVVDTATALSDLLWQVEWERNEPTSPERKAAFHRALFEQIGRIHDETVRRYYEQDFRARLRMHLEAPGARERPQKGAGWRKDPQSATRTLRPSRRPNHADLALQRQRVALGLLALNPMLVDELAERLANIPIGDMALDSVRNQILSLSVTHSDLDAEAFASQVKEEITLASGSAHEVLNAFESVLISGKSALSMRSRGVEDTIDVVREAVVQLFHSLENDGVQLQLRHQATAFNGEANDLERLTKQVAIERHRLTDGRG